MQKKYLFFISAFLLALNFFMWREVFALNGPKYLKVDFLNVGQGDSAFIQTPEGHQILIDGGPGSAVLERLSNVMPFWDKSIDLVILTHPESDHMQGILNVLQRYKVENFLWTGIVKNDAENKELAFLLEKAQAPQNSFLAKLSNFRPTKVVATSAGKEIKAGGVLIDILFPFENLEGQKIKNTSNDSCVVAKLIYGNNSFLFVGDISSVAEKQLVNSGENILSDVLKVAHHGSKYSTSDLFLQNVKPKFAVIEVGKNSYGHPTPETLQRLEKFGIKVLRTDINGDVDFVSDGNNINLIKN
ncbi:MAG: ComEC/Rec2 family competence protein [Candidatus Staskawiczbacteria bacterium]|nr:ComEC/Rec2 family competence protein [Candidatus Staskawiczbacteria bacterium]